MLHQIAALPVARGPGRTILSSLQRPYGRRRRSRLAAQDAACRTVRANHQRSLWLDRSRRHRPDASATSRVQTRLAAAGRLRGVRVEIRDADGRRLAAQRHRRDLGAHAALAGLRTPGARRPRRDADGFVATARRWVGSTRTASCTSPGARRPLAERCRNAPDSAAPRAALRRLRQKPWGEHHETSSSQLRCWRCRLPPATEAPAPSLRRRRAP